MLVRELSPGPLDVIGDVHGEIEPLRALLRRLGYREDGAHPDGRRLVFVGDLTDRGPDSPAVVRVVRSLVEAGRAQCVLGNHELNILRRDRKEGNRWFFDEPESHREEIEAFFRALPLALEREDLRVVHACWSDELVDRARGARDVLALSRAEVERIDQELEADGLAEAARREAEGWDFTDPDRPPPLLECLARARVRRQNQHPVKVLTSGLEAVAEAPFWAGGRWRLERRVPWWERYRGRFVIVGHYWRSRAPGVYAGKGPDLFADAAPEQPLGPGCATCIDFSIGKRSRERAAGPPYATALAAYRWPERRLVFSD